MFGYVNVKAIDYKQSNLISLSNGWILENPVLAKVKRLRLVSPARRL
jgi:nitrogen fixation protein